MSKRHKRPRPKMSAPASSPPQSKRGLWAGVIVFAIIAVAAVVWVLRHKGSIIASPLAAPKSSNALAIADKDLPTNEVAHALMVTVELDFGKQPPSFRDAVKQIERRYEPVDGVGRTFAMLDAYGQTNADGKLHISMHLSMEKPGIGSLVFPRTGEVLWKSRIAAAPTGPPPPKNLTVLVEDETGKTQMLDGSKGITRALDVPLHDSPSRVRDIWPDGAEREWTFIYSVCGCPVKVKVRRSGETTVRASDLPVMFPDDPEAMAVIANLMGWPSER